MIAHLLNSQSTFEVCHPIVIQPNKYVSYTPNTPAKNRNKKR